MAPGGLADPVADGDEVVAVDRRGAGRDRAGRALGGVAGVAGDALFGGDAFGGHLQHVELGGHLEQCAGELGVGVQRAGIADERTH